MSKSPSLGSNLALDVDKLVESRLLVQANSGGGKSWAIRRICEQTYAKVPQIIIDVEGEFHTLRERYDYVLANQKGGDTLADIKTAPLLARRLLELNVSAIVDIYELGARRAQFVKLFLDSLVNAPRDLWHPLLVVVDEANMFCPEGSPSESSAAVTDLMTRGRKRGFAGILATQRISSLNKAAAAECNNKLIGRSALDIDMVRSAKELGFTSKDEIQALRKLPPGTFHAFGPAISDVVTQVKIGPVETTHPKAGARALPPTPPRERIKKILAQLADLPHEAEEEAKTMTEMRAKVKQLEGELKKAKNAAPDPVVEVKTVEKVLINDKQIKRVETVLGQFDHVAKRLNELGEKLTTEAGNVRGALSYATTVAQTQHLAFERPPINVPSPRDRGSMVYPNNTGIRTGRTPSYAPNIANGPKPAKKSSMNHVKLPVGEAAVLQAAIQFAETGVLKKRLSVLTGYKRSTRDAYIARLREKGLLEERGDSIFPTAEGLDALPNAEPLPTGEALRDFWFNELPSGEKVILEYLVDAYPRSVVKTDLDEATEFKRSTRDAYISRLAAKLLVEETSRGEITASANLFD